MVSIIGLKAYYTDIRHIQEEIEYTVMQIRGSHIRN